MSRKFRSIFRAIYQAAQGAARIRGVDGKVTFSKWFDIQSGVIQGDIISPVLFILALDQLVQTIDTGGEGVRVGSIGKLHVLGYADDAAMMEETEEMMTTRLTKFADESMTQADMKVKPSKTFTQIVQRQQAIGQPTTAEIEKKRKEIQIQVSVCRRGMQ